MDSGRRGFLTKILGVAGAAVVPIPGSALDTTANVFHHTPRDEARDRVTDEPQPKSDYGLMVQSDTYSPNPDLQRLRSDGTVASRPGSTSVYVRAWIDEEVYGIRRPDGTIDEDLRDQLSRAFAESVLAADRIMTPVLRIMRRSALGKHALKSGVPVPHSFF